MIGYAFHPEAEADLNDIWDYIAADNPAAADRVLTDMHGTLESLIEFPHQGRRRTDLTSRPLRFVRSGNYLIAYAPDENPIWVVAIVHGQRSPRVIAAILRDRE